MDLAQILIEEVWRMELVNNDSLLLLVATSHRNIKYPSTYVMSDVPGKNLVNQILDETEKIKKN